MRFPSCFSRESTEGEPTSRAILGQGWGKQKKFFRLLPKYHAGSRERALQQHAGAVAGGRVARAPFPRYGRFKVRIATRLEEKKTVMADKRDEGGVSFVTST